MLIRKFQLSDADVLADLHNLLFPDDLAHTAVTFNAEIMQAKQGGGAAWVIVEGEMLGYLVVAPVPGLGTVGDLHGGILPVKQRQGLGSLLLNHALTELQGGQLRQIAYSVSDLESAAACFLRSHHFFVEHVEWILIRPSQLPLPSLSTAISVKVRTLDRVTAVVQFCRLYDHCFAGLPWNQPFTPREVSLMLDDPAQILFLEVAGQLIGFAWLYEQAGRLGVIEPLAIVPEMHAHGYGRYLLTYAMHQLIQDGMSQMKIGTWRKNHPAINLYRSLGFEHKDTLTYLAYDL